MRPPADLPLEIVLLAEAFARRLQMPVGDFWAVLYRQAPTPPGWAAAWSDAFGEMASGREALHKRLQKSIVVNNDMDNSHKLAISRSRQRATPRDPFSQACRKAGLTRGGLARALNIDPALLSRYRKGTRPIPQERADKVKALTGWPADKSHWPGGIVPLD